MILKYFKLLFCKDDGVIDSVNKSNFEVLSFYAAPSDI